MLRNFNVNELEKIWLLQRATTVLANTQIKNPLIQRYAQRSVASEGIAFLRSSEEAERLPILPHKYQRRLQTPSEFLFLPIELALVCPPTIVASLPVLLYCLDASPVGIN